MKSYEQEGRDAGYVEGATVRVLRKCKDFELGWSIRWASIMDKMIGKTFVVYSTARGSLANFDDSCHYPWHVCELIAPPPEPKKPEFDPATIQEGAICLVWDEDKIPAKPKKQAFLTYLPKAEFPFVCFSGGVSKETATGVFEWKHCAPVNLPDEEIVQKSLQP